MRILIIGGTRLVGRQIAAAAIERGHDVTLFNRGKASPDGLRGARQLIGDRDSDLSALESGTWDATIDVCAYGHRQVRRLFETLGNRGGHYTFISTISVYSDAIPETGFTEDAPLLEPEWDDAAGMAKYGALKVGCEQVAAASAAAGLLVIRPGYVIGPYDYTERFTHWIRAVSDGKPFDGPAADQPLQCIDGRDLGEFTVRLVERGEVGTFNATAPQDVPTFSHVLTTIANALEVDLPEVRWAEPSDATESLHASESLPLSSSSAWWPLMRADLTKAIAAGLTWRPLADTVRATALHIGL